MWQLKLSFQNLKLLSKGDLSVLFLTTIDLSVCLLCITKHTPKFCLFVILNIKMKGAGGTELAKYKVALEQLNQN